MQFAGDSNDLLRTAIIESSWAAIGADKELRSKYEQMARAKNKQYAIVKIAVILLRRIRSVWINEKEYIAAEC